MSERTLVRTLLLVPALFVLLSCWTAPASADTGWSPVIIATGQYREQIKSTPIEMRPNRPLHFYGNTVRRSYHRGVSSDTTRTNPFRQVVEGSFLSRF